MSSRRSDVQRRQARDSGTHSVQEVLIATSGRRLSWVAASSHASPITAAIRRPSLRIRSPYVRMGMGPEALIGHTIQPSKIDLMVSYLQQTKKSVGRSKAMADILSSHSWW